MDNQESNSQSKADKPKKEEKESIIPEIDLLTLAENRAASAPLAEFEV